MRRVLALFTVMAVALIVASGVALAGTTLAKLKGGCYCASLQAASGWEADLAEAEQMLGQRG